MRTTSTSKTLPVVMLLLAATAAASCAEVEAEVPEATVTQKGLAFRSVEWGGQDWPGEVSVMQTFTLSSANLSWVKDLNSTIYITQIDITATSGVDDLGFIHYAHVTMADAEKVWLPVVLVDYMRAENQGPLPVLHAKTLYPVNVSEVWKAKKLLVTIALAGKIPDKSWTVDLTLHLSGKISYKL
jgi:hypothetical protein